MRLATLTLLALAASGCASHSRSIAPRDPAAREAMLLTRNDIAPGRRCEIVDSDAPLPSIATVLDTAAMPEYLRQAGAVALRGYELLSVRFDSTGKAVRARVIESTLPDSIRGLMQQAIASSLLERGPGAPLAVRVRVDLTPAPVYRIGKSEYCQPVPVPVAPSSATTVGAGEQAIMRSATKIDYELEVGADGQATAVRFVPSLTPDEEQRLRPVVMQQRWKPAIDDGLPVASLVKGSRVIKSVLVARPVSH